MKIALLKIISGVWWCAIALAHLKRQGLQVGLYPKNLHRYANDN